MIQEIDDLPPIRVKDNLVLVLINNKWYWAKQTGQSKGNYYYDILGIKYPHNLDWVNHGEVAEIINSMLTVEEIADSLKAVEKYNEALKIVRRRKHEAQTLSKESVRRSGSIDYCS